MTIYTVKVKINGTDKNTFAELWGLKQNPFGQIAKAEYDAFDNLVNRLDGDPFRTKDELKEFLLKAFGGEDNDFIQECLSHYMPGERTEFTFSFDGVD